MNNLATKYDELGRHEDALLLFQKSLEIRQQVLPKNDPQIGKNATLSCVYIFNMTY
jgi:hypothetical protein